jgi:two-component system response regulator FixJ
MVEHTAGLHFAARRRIGASAFIRSDRNIRMPRTIAIIDDDEAVRDSLAALLSSAGYEVSTFGNSAEFLAVAPTTEPDGVILDHQMRGLTGVELAERLGRGSLRNKIVMISGNVTDTIRSRARRAGVAAILDKPFSDDALLATIEAALGGTSRD